jgi:ribosome recycling factor
MPETSNITSVIKQSEDRMKKSLEALQKELNNIRAARANPAMLDHIQVEYYGSEMPLNQLAQVSVPESRILLITPYDKGSVSAIEKSIQKSDLNITPQSDGNVIRLILPELSGERRQELVKQVKHRLEETRVAIRNIRRDANEEIKKLSGKGHSEDEVKAAQDDVQKMTDRYIKKGEDAAVEKEKSILTV